MPITTSSSSSASQKQTLKRKGIVSLVAFTTLTIIMVVVALHLLPAPYFAKRAVFSGAQLDFQYLEPTKLPTGVAITEKRIGITPYNVSAELNLRTDDWVYVISETKYRPEDAQNISTQVDNYNPASIKPTCTQQRSVAGKNYRLCHWVDYGKISVYEVKFTQGNTYINARLPTNTKTLLSTPEIDEFVDSFRPASPASLKVLRLGPP